MTDIVSSNEIEEIVGTSRHATSHYARAVSAEQMVYILHSTQCRETFVDLRECPFSKALDNGIDIQAWQGMEDQPVWVMVSAQRLLPAMLRLKEAP